MFRRRESITPRRITPETTEFRTFASRFTFLFYFVSDSGPASPGPMRAPVPYMRI
jgi:hypothetical protein